MNTTFLNQNTSTLERPMRIVPGRTEHKKIITTGKIATPLGPMIVAAVEEGICILGFVDQKELETELGSLQKYFNASVVPGHHHYFLMINEQLEEYFAGKRTQFTVPLVTPGTDFQKRVWQSLLEIPYGATRSYGEQATFLDNPKAIRAVAQANGRNRVAILIPCHRVIGSDGSLTGYGAGLPRKEWLLNHEAAIIRES